MEDDIGLIDYLRIIWKRKLLLIAGTMVGLVAGWAVVHRAPELYRIELILNMGKKLAVLPSGSFGLVAIDSPKTIVDVIQAKYSLSKERISKYKYALKFEVIDNTDLYRISTRGPAEKEAAERFEESVREVCDESSQKTELSLLPLYEVIERLHVSQREIIEEMAITKEVLEKLTPVSDIKNLENVSSVINVERALWEIRTILKGIQLELLFYESFARNADEYKTRIVGDMRRTTIRPEKARKIIKVAGLSFVISLCLVFFIEYIETLKRIEKVRKQT